MALARSPSEWVHRTAKGTEYGTASPTGRLPGTIASLSRAFATAWETRRVVWILAVHDYKASFRAQSLGMLWSIFNPLIMLVTLTVAFTMILRIDIPYFPVFYFSGMIFWQFFISSLTGSSTSFVSRGQLVMMTNFPRFLVPVIPLLTKFFDFVVELFLLFGLYLLFPTAFQFGLALLFVPVILLLLVLFTHACALLAASLQVRFRDVQYLVGALGTVGFWTTPILYSTSMAPPWIIPYLRLNPLAGIVEGSRSCIMDGRVPELITLLPAAVGTVLMYALAARVHRRENLTLTDYL
jgi:ABC-type polysaccharide/polyol phosphate export permease